MNFPFLQGGSMSTGGGGSSIFGSVPAQLPMPNPYKDLSAVYPNLSGTNAQASAAILSKLKGQLSPDTVSAINDAAARFGVASGMPGSGLAHNRTLRDLGLTSEQEQQQGLADYASLIPAISGTQTVRPETQFGINETNSINAAAPNPTAANTYAQSLFDKYLKMLGGSGGSASTWNAAPITEHFFKF
jgi:hypothetical protein